MKTWFVTLRLTDGSEVFRSLKRGSREEAILVAEQWAATLSASVVSVEDLRTRLKTVGKSAT